MDTKLDTMKQDSCPCPAPLIVTKYAEIAGPSGTSFGCEMYSAPRKEDHQAVIATLQRWADIRKHVQESPA